jgi:hypothetical protein
LIRLEDQCFVKRGNDDVLIVICKYNPIQTPKREGDTSFCPIQEHIIHVCTQADNNFRKYYGDKISVDTNN